MITLTFEPTCPEQAALLGEFLPKYMRAAELTVSGAAQAVETSAVEAPAPKATRAKKPAPAATQEASAPEAPTPSPSPAAETSAPADEGNAAAEPSAPETTAAPAVSSEGSAKQWTLEEVRARLAELSKAGKQQQVVGIIGAFGVKKLTDVPPEKYASLMKEAEALA